MLDLPALQVTNRARWIALGGLSPAENALNDPSVRRMLLARAGGRICALPLAHVVETMRPRPTSPLAGAPAFVRGVAIIRGEPTPVVDMGELLGAAGAPVARFVVVRAGGRTAAVAVESVIGISVLEDAATGSLAPLLAGARRSAVESLGALDRDLLVVLDTARLVPAEVWQAMSGSEVGV